MKRIQNFNAGPSAIPLEVLQTAQQELLDYKGTGMSVMEISHRTKEYDEINDGAMALVHELFGLGENYKVLFMQDDAFSQFSIVPMNLLSAGKTAAYVDTGVWADKAIKEAKKVGNVSVIASSKADKYAYIPKISDIKTPQDAAYLHVTSNNTIFGTQFDQFPDPGSVPMVCDMSSDIASRRRDFTRFALIYAGAQKNLGPAGVTLVIIREDLLSRSSESLGTMFSYNTHAAEKSLFNTPPVFSIYMMRLSCSGSKNRVGWKQLKK
jgi:phosphoserine aminotransferase